MLHDVPTIISVPGYVGLSTIILAYYNTTGCMRENFQTGENMSFSGAEHVLCLTDVSFSRFLMSGTARGWVLGTLSFIISCFMTPSIKKRGCHSQHGQAWPDHPRFNYLLEELRVLKWEGEVQDPQRHHSTVSKTTIYDTAIPYWNAS